MRMGGRVAELLVYGDLSTGAANDLVGNTELARKMVREWGMSEEIGPMAWGSQGQVFLGEDLMHTRDYSEDTSRVIDDEVERILRAQEERAVETLTRHRSGLEAVARALLEQESIDGQEVGRLVDEAYGQPVHATGAKAVPHFHGNGTNGNGSATNGSGANGAPPGEPGARRPAGRRGRPARRAVTTGESAWPSPPWPAAPPPDPHRPRPPAAGRRHLGRASRPRPSPSSGRRPQWPPPSAPNR